MIYPPGHLLVLLIDLHPVWWARHSLPTVLQSTLLLANSHILQNPLNRYLATVQS